MKKLREVEEATPAPSSLTRSSVLPRPSSLTGSISGLHRAATPQDVEAAFLRSPISSRPPKAYEPYSFINELRPDDLQIDERSLSLPPSASVPTPKAATAATAATAAAHAKAQPADQNQKPPSSFIKQLRPTDAWMPPPPPPWAATPSPPRPTPPRPAPSPPPEEVSASELLDDDSVGEDLADLADVHPADDDNDDRTIERYAPSSVRDLDYDTDSTSEVPPEWLDHLAASARPSDRPPAVAESLPPTIRPPAPFIDHEVPPPPPPNFFGSFPPGSFPTPSSMLPVTSLRPPYALTPTPTPTVPTPPSSSSSSSSSPLPMALRSPLQPRSNPIPWVPTPPTTPVASPLRRGLLFFACVLLWSVLIVAALRLLIGH